MLPPAAPHLPGVAWALQRPASRRKLAFKKPRLAAKYISDCDLTVYAQLEDIERAIDDGVNTIKSLVRDPRMCPGAGATEMYCEHMVGEMGKKDPTLA